jgi:hypothetical protein
MRAILLCAPSRAYGEINSLILLAKSIDAAGGDVWFLASPLAAEVARLHFPQRVFDLTWELERNHVTFWRMIKKFRPDLILFSEAYEILRPQRKADCPIFTPRWLDELEQLDCAFVFVDFIAHVPILRSIANCEFCAGQFGKDRLEAFLKRLWVVLPCPLNEPGPVNGRCGIPYRAQRLPLTIEPHTRARVRSRFLGEDEQEGILILRTGSSWQTDLANKFGQTLYHHLGNLFAFYLADLPYPVTVVSVSSRHQIAHSGSDLRICNISNLPPHDFDQLVLSSDLIVTENEIGYTLGKTLGRVPGMVLVNSFELEEILEREKGTSAIRKMVLEMEHRRPGCVYPHKIFPIRAGKEEFVEEIVPGMGPGDGLSRPPTSTLRLGRMKSAPFVKAELYGGDTTRLAFRSILCDPAFRAALNEQEEAYVTRLNRAEDGVTVLSRIAAHNSLVENMAL